MNQDVLLALLDDTSEPLLALDEAASILYANAAAAGRFGRPRQLLVGKPFASLVTSGDRGRFRTAFAEVEATGIEVTLALETGPAPVVLRRLPGVEPTVVTAAIVEHPGAYVPRDPAVDVAASLDRFFLRYPHGVVGLRRNGRIAFANPRARQLLGPDAAPVGGQLRAGPGLAGLVRRLMSMAAVVHETRIDLEDGRRLRVLGIGTRRDAPAVLVLEDVTERDRRDRVTREFLRNAAHQLRTPLTGIATAVQVLQSGAKETPAERDRFLTHIETHVARLTSLAQGLLVLARAQAGEPLRLELVELRPLLVAVAERAAPAEGVSLTVECAPSLAALAQPDLAQEALAALVENAVAHTREGSIALHALEHDGRVSIEVSDTGGGILPEHRDHIFEAFYRPSTDGNGFGLGLAIAAQAVAAMDGDLTVDDVEGGTRFTIRLPSARVLS